MSLLLGDCLERMRDIDNESIDLIYLDPPFFTQREQALKPRDNSKKYSFDDKWDSIDAYRIYMEERLRECFRVLKRTGSIFLHCNKSASHHLRIALDNTFGVNNFQSEIVWYYASKRLDNPVKTNSYLLDKGKDRYKNLTDEELNILEIMDAVPVQRNKGIDGFLREYFNGKPISVKIQKKNESLSEARQYLISASKKKKCSLMVLVRTQRDDLYDELLIEERNDSSLLVVDRYDIQIKNWIKSKQD